MRVIENNMLFTRLQDVKTALEGAEVFKKRKVGETKQIPYSFVFYTLQRFLENNTLEDELLDAVTEGSGDNGIDILYIEEDGNDITVHVFQVKYKEEKNLSKTIGENEVSSFLDKVQKIFIEADPHVPVSNGLLQKQIDRFYEISREASNVKIKLYFATNGADLNGQEKDTINRFINKHSPTIDGYHVLCDYDFYIDKSDVEIETVTLDVDNEKISNSQEMLSYIVTTSAYQIAILYEKFKDRILEKNVRKLLKGKINKQIAESLQKNPKMFWYKNNGLSIVCRRVQPKSIAGRLSFDMDNPYIVNGGQTTKTIYNLFSKIDRNNDDEVAIFHDAKILVRIYQTTDVDVINSIVLGTNSQNKITVADLKSLHPNVRKIKQYFNDNDVILVTKRDSEIKLSSRSITAEFLLQVYWAIFGGEPHKSKASKSKLVDDLYDEVYGADNTYKDLYTSYLIYEDVKKKIQLISNYEIKDHGLYSVLYAMVKIFPKLKAGYDKNISASAFEATIRVIEDVINKEKQNPLFSAHNFFKSHKSTQLIRRACEPVPSSDELNLFSYK